jgi:CelD/BcsL family acetyltransferase involved in cellulose biosynthesis
VLESFEESEAWRAQWDATVAATNGNLYMTLDWCRTWWRFYGFGRALRILVLLRGEEWVAVLPMFVETLWLGPVRLKVAKLIGGDFSIQLCNPPIRGDVVASELVTALRYLHSTCGCDAVVFSPLSAAFPGFEQLRAACSQPSSEVWLAGDRQSDIHSLFDLPATFEEYLGGLGRSQRANYKRDWNLLNKSFAVASDCVSAASQLAAEFPAFSALHKTQWNAEGRQGHFDDWPSAYDFNLGLVRSQAPLGRVRLHRLLLDGQVVSYQYCFAYSGRLYWRLPARVTGESWKRYGLGRMGLAKLIESAIGERIRSIEGGQGHYDYKQQMGAAEPPVFSLLVASRRRGAGLRLRWGRLFSSALNAAYYKILFRRVYPRVPSLRRPLARLWIRSRF